MQRSGISIIRRRITIYRRTSVAKLGTGKLRLGSVRDCREEGRRVRGCEETQPPSTHCKAEHKAVKLLLLRSDLKEIRNKI
jgi:hypothetical protein